MKKIVIDLLLTSFIAAGLTACWSEDIPEAGAARRQVTDLTATPGDEEVQLAWSLPEGWNPTDFIVYYTNTDSETVTLRTDGEMNCTIGGLVNGTQYTIIDTAGIRRKRAVEDETLERYSVLRSIAAIRRCDVALLLIDAQDGVTEQDTKIAGLIRDEGKAVIIIVNKWDAVEKETGTLEQFRKEVLDALKFMDYAPVLFLSAKTGQRVHTVIDMVDQVWAQTSKRIPTGVLNDVLNDATADLQPPATNGRRLKIYYITQQSACPPTFILFVNEEALMHFAYQRYLENYFRKTFDFTGTPIRFILREKTKEEK